MSELTWVYSRVDKNTGVFHLAFTIPPLVWVLLSTCIEAHVTQVHAPSLTTKIWWLSSKWMLVQPYRSTPPISLTRDDWGCSAYYAPHTVSILHLPRNPSTHSQHPALDTGFAAPFLVFPGLLILLSGLWDLELEARIKVLRWKWCRFEARSCQDLTMIDMPVSRLLLLTLKSS